MGAAAAGRVNRRQRSSFSRREAIAGLEHARQAIVSGDPDSARSGIAALESARIAWKGDWPAGAAQAAAEARRALEATAYGGGELVDAVTPLERLVAILSIERRDSSRGTMATLLLLSPFVLSVVLAQAQESADPVTRWHAANQAYRAGAFERAAATYGDLLRAHADPDLEANMAAALWRLGARGEALLHYRRAVILSPRDRAIRRDLKQLSVELSNPPDGESPLAEVLSWMRLDEVLTLLLVANTLGVSLLVVGRRRRWVNRLGVMALAVAITIGIVAAGHGVLLNRGDQAIALETLALSAEPGGPPIASVSEGSVVRVLESNVEGARVKAPDLPAGWVAADRLGGLDSILR